jgi:Leucine-rich repeat (LRR) protein
MTPPRLTLSRVTLRSMVTVLDTPENGFVALVRLAGLDPASDFRGAVLDGVDFGTDDLSNFDFSDADLTGADTSRATGLDKIVTNAGTRLPPQVRHPPKDFHLADARQMIADGKVPPKNWWPFITEMNLNLRTWENLSTLSPLANLTALRRLNLSGNKISDISPLSGLTALEDLDLKGTIVSDVSALSGLTALKSLDLSYTNVYDVSALATLTVLKSLNLRGTFVRDVSAVSHVPSIQLDEIREVRTLNISKKSGRTW